MNEGMKKKEPRKLRRVGDTAKCPACGWKLDSDAYRCPKCRIYFCFKCRARVAKGDTQYQCADQSCDFYGKLLCAACTVQVPIETEQQTPESELRPIGCLLVLLISVGIGALVASFQSWGVIAIVTSISAMIGSALFFLYLGSIWFWSEWLLFKDVQVQVRSVAQHRCCVQCRHRVKKM